MTTLQNDHKSEHLLVFDDDDEEVYYESFDRILSSSNSSTSNSEDETPHCGVLHCNHDFSGNSNVFKLSTIMPLNSYDVWTCNDSFSCCSLQQRRDRLLFALGLGSDSCFARRKSSSCHGFDGSSSFVSVDHMCSATFNEVMIRSKSENSFESSSFSSIRSVSDTVNVNSNDSNNDNGVLYNVDGNSNDCDSNVVVDDDVVDNDNDDHLVGDGCVDSSANVDRMCTIKNLDTGKEFVVNEMSENGTWRELKEVGTGRKMTMKEFEMNFGHSPIVQELMRRQNVEDMLNNNGNNSMGNAESNGNGSIRNEENGSVVKKKVSWLKNIKKVAGSVAGYSSKERRSSDDKDTTSDRGGRRSSSATDDSQDGSFNGPERVRVRHYGKSLKELSALYKSQEIKAHNGSIWAIEFSLDGMYLASAGEDCVIHVWQVVESQRKGELLMDRSDDVGLNLFLSTNGLAEPNSVALSVESRFERRRRSRSSSSRKSLSLEHIMVPGSVFGLSEKPFCSFQGHSDDVLDLSWSKSKLLLSSSMDKTVRLWNLSTKTCLKTFCHSDYVTCIQFNPVDDRYFISGSLDAKVRIWSIPDRQVVDWNDLHEMVTAACYTPDGQGALVGSYKGSCRLYNTSENKLQRKCLINLHNNNKKTHLKKITGFQFAPGSSSEVLITSADSRIRLVDDMDLVHKFKGFRNTNSQISGSLTANGKYVVCASEDSQVYVWKLEGNTRPTRKKGVTVTSSYEHFHCQDVTIAIPWPGFSETWESRDPCQNGSHPQLNGPSSANHPPTPVEFAGFSHPPFQGTVSSAPSGYFFDRISATWPEEELLLATNNRSSCFSWDFSNGVMQNRSAWGMVIVTAGVRGEIRTFQNFGLPVRI